MLFRKKENIPVDGPKYRVLFENRAVIDRPDGSGIAVVFQIQSLRDITFKDGRPPILAGDVGGWIEFRHNLSQHGTSWIYPDAAVIGKTVIRGKRYGGNPGSVGLRVVRRVNNEPEAVSV